MSLAVCKQLQQIISEEEEEDRGYITAKDFMNDFATEEFLHKNIRVRPLSNMSRMEGDDGKTNDPYNKSQNELYGAGGDEDEKFQQMKIIEMDEQREHLKARKEAYLLKKRIEEEKLAKKRK